MLVDEVTNELPTVSRDAVKLLEQALNFSKEILLTALSNVILSVRPVEVLISTSPLAQLATTRRSLDIVFVVAVVLLVEVDVVVVEVVVVVVVDVVVVVVAVDVAVVTAVDENGDDETTTFDIVSCNVSLITAKLVLVASGGTSTTTTRD